MDLREAAQQALEALEDSHQNINPERRYADELTRQIADSITALRAALAEATTQESRQVEPVAWLYIPSERLRDAVLTSAPSQARLAADYGCEVQPLYPAPSKREPLLIEGNEFIGDPPGPAKTWGEYFENVVTTSRLSGLRVSALANPVAHEFAGVKITEVRLPENMAMRFDGDVLVIERAHGIGGEE